ncbi:MAG: hypothetical protein B7Y25_03905 [Alphaproteobacteria bacterium 16-39-46]|nr:MAG: hypothetical protein B7Y25_03905 [Alphaproteobacteria bacterium 16-39-46]OZA43129.1 MAG: hypothetical protein B7X84_04070 [Alphaproteobacteria bacterium 17-39-52]HQS84030.1 hypothetical protein [Alphaproteobacteria bacterium]HQS93627.1 hypothetical protein [Alphaproteobacteria bacterium]
MVYNLRKTFKDVLKIISLGVMASINGVSSDVFAMDEKYQEGRGGFKTHAMTELQGEIDEEEALRLALELSCEDESIPNAKVLPPPYTPRAAAAAVDEGTEAMKRALEASRASLQEEEDFQRILGELAAESLAAAPNVPAFVQAPNPIHAERRPHDPALAGEAVALGKSSASKSHKEEKPEQDPSTLSVKTWTEAEIGLETFNDYIKPQFDCILDSLLQEQERFHQITENTKKMNALKESLLGADTEDQQQIQTQIWKISSEILKLQHQHSRWLSDSAIPEIKRQLNDKNRGEGVSEKIEKIVASMF